MKKILWLLAAACIALVSCNKDGDKTPEGETPAAPAVVKSVAETIWHSATYGGKTVSVPHIRTTETYTYNEDKKIGNVNTKSESPVIDDNGNVTSWYEGSNEDSPVVWDEEKGTVSFSGQIYTLDSDGKVTVGGKYVYSYDENRQLVQYVYNNASTSTFTWENGNIVSRSWSGDTYTYTYNTEANPFQSGIDVIAQFVGIPVLKYGVFGAHVKNLPTSEVHSGTFGSETTSFSYRKDVEGRISRITQTLNEYSSTYDITYED